MTTSPEYLLCERLEGLTSCGCIENESPIREAASAIRSLVEDRERLREAAFRAGWRSGFTGAMQSGPLPNEDADWLKYSRPSLSVVGE